MKRAPCMPELFPDLAMPAPERPRSPRRARRAKAEPPAHVRPMRNTQAPAPGRDVPLRHEPPPAVVPSRHEWAEARQWCEKMLATTDPMLKVEYQANMVRCLMALDHIRVMH